MDKVKMFREITYKLGNLYEKKNACYGDSFGETFQKLGVISAVTRISDKYNRLVSLATNENIDDLGESIEDTLVDLANYSIMTLMELRLKQGTKEEKIIESKMNGKSGTLIAVCGDAFMCKQDLKDSLIKGEVYHCNKSGFITDKNNVMIELSKYPSLDWNKYLKKMR